MSLPFSAAPAVGQMTGRDGVAVLLLVAFAAAMYLPWIAVPLTGTDHAAGIYSGLFAQCYERFGFWELRGMPLWPQIPADPGDAALYQNHPPLGVWLASAFGTAEWQLRLPSVVGVGLAALGLFVLLRRQLTTWWACGGAALFLSWPVNMLFCQVSLEVLVMPCAVWLLLATIKVMETEGGVRVRWRLVQVAAAFLGPCVDWPFAWFCVALVPLTLGSGRAWFAALFVPAVASCTALSLVLLWRWWATNNPAFASVAVAGQGVGELIDATILKRPDMLEMLANGWQFMQRDYTSSALWIGCASLPLLATRDLRLCIGLLIPALLHVLVFADHALVHVQFWAYFGLVLTVALAMLGSLTGVVLRRVAAVVLLALCVNAAVTSHQWWRHAETTFFRDVGHVLTEAADVRDADGGSSDAAVLHNCRMPYAYYLRSPNIALKPWYDPEHLSLALEKTQAPHVRYLWLKVEDQDGEVLWHRPEIERFLAAFPRTRVPELEVDYGTHAFDVRRNVTEAWLYELK